MQNPVIAKNIYIIRQINKKPTCYYFSNSKAERLCRRVPSVSGFGKATWISVASWMLKGDELAGALQGDSWAISCKDLAALLQEKIILDIDAGYC